MRRTLTISRRTALKGLGVSIALPMLEAMRPRPAPGRIGRSRRCPAAHRRSSTSPTASTCPTGRRAADVGGGLELPPILEPLRAVKDDVLVLSGLTLNPARALGDGGGDHARAMASFLTGRHPRKTDGADLQAGISVDQLAARAIGRRPRDSPRWRSAARGAGTRGECDHGYSCAYQSNLSWRGESTPVAKQINPRLVFDRLFGGPAGRVRRRRSGPRRSPAQERPRLRRRGRAGGSARRLGTADRRKLDEYLTGVREIERRIDRARPTVERGGIKLPRPLGIPADYREHLRLMADLLALAFQCDLTRIATFVFANDGSNRSYPADRRPRRPPRPLAPRRRPGQAAADPRDQSIPRRAARVPAREAEVDPRGDRHPAGPLPDRLRQRDQRRQRPCITTTCRSWLAGRANGTVKPGRHVRYPKETPLTNLYVSILDRLGVRSPASATAPAASPGWRDERSSNPGSDPTMNDVRLNRISGLGSVRAPIISSTGILRAGILPT